MAVKENSLPVFDAWEVFKGPSIHSNLLTKETNLLSVVLGEDVHSEDTISDLGLGGEIDLKQLGLELALVWSVVLQGLN